MFKIFDTHCHYNLEPLYSNWQELWQEAQKKELKKALVVGVDFESCHKSLEISEKEKNIYSSLGLHPLEVLKIDRVETIWNKFIKIFFSNFKLNQKIKALGETGLDYFQLRNLTKKNKEVNIIKQKKLFINHLQLNNKLNLPLIIHVRDNDNFAHFEILTMIKRYSNLKSPFIFHCLSGNQKFIKQALNFNCYFGVDGNITYKNANNLRELIQYIPKNKLLLETDAPFLPPEPFRGKINEPKMIKETALFLRKNFEIDLEQVYYNSLEAFKLI